MTTEQTVTQFAIQSVERINKANAPEQLRRLGEHCIKQLYGKGNNYDAQYILDNLVQWARKPMVSWFRRLGINIVDPTVNSARFMCLGVVDQKRQTKAIAMSKTLAVMASDHTVKQAKKPVVLKGTEDERVQSAMVKLIAKLKKDDPLAAGLLNDIWTRKAIEYYMEAQQPELKAA